MLPQKQEIRGRRPFRSEAENGSTLGVNIFSKGVCGGANDQEDNFSNEEFRSFSGMRIHIISLFPESIRPYLDTSIMQRAHEKGLFDYTIYNLADHSVRNTRRVDDRPYGGGAGTLITIEPLVNCIRQIMTLHGDMPIILMGPRGDILDQSLCLDLSKNSEQYIIICGHYEGVDARIFDVYDVREVSIGAYVLSSGELASLVLIDSIVRLIPGVISEASLLHESYSEALEGKKEYPQYSRPEIYEDYPVPKVLLSGDLRAIHDWQMEHRS